MQSKFDANRLLCTTSLQEEKKIKNVLLNRQKFVLLLNEYIVMLLKFKKKFHKYLSTYMLHSELREESGWVWTKQILSALQLSVSYVQKEEK